MAGEEEVVAVGSNGLPDGSRCARVPNAGGNGAIGCCGSGGQGGELFHYAAEEVAASNNKRHGLHLGASHRGFGSVGRD